MRRILPHVAASPNPGGPVFQTRYLAPCAGARALRSDDSRSIVHSPTLLAHYIRSQYAEALRPDTADDVDRADRRAARRLVRRLAYLRGEAYRAVLAEFC